MESKEIREIKKKKEKSSIDLVTIQPTMSGTPSATGPPARKKEKKSDSFAKAQNGDQAGHLDADAGKDDAPESSPSDNDTDPLSDEEAEKRSITPIESNENDSTFEHHPTPPTPLYLEIHDYVASSGLYNGTDGGGFCPVEVGQLFDSRYEAIKLLGAGGFGSVWMVMDKELLEYKALKICIAGDRVSSQNEIDGLKTIQDMVQEGSHRHFMMLFTEFEHQSDAGWHRVLCTEFVGPNLATVRQGLDKLHINHVKTIMRQVLYALEYLHVTCKLIHGDIKPSNIMLKLRPQELQKFAYKRIGEGDAPTYYGMNFNDPWLCFNLKVGDMGNSTSIETCGGLTQTCHYRAPEVFLNNKYGTPADIWSVGCTAMEMVMGDILFWCSDDLGEETKEHRKYHLNEMSKSLGKIPKRLFVLDKNTKSLLTTRNSIAQSNHEPNDFIVEKLKTSDLSQEDPEELADLLHGMMNYDQKKRFTAEQALDHTFIIWGPNT